MGVVSKFSFMHYAHSRVINERTPPSYFSRSTLGLQEGFRGVGKGDEGREGKEMEGLDFVSNFLPE